MRAMPRRRIFSTDPHVVNAARAFVEAAGWPDYLARNVVAWRLSQGLSVTFSRVA